MAASFTIRWKVVAIAGGGAFALSFLLGLFSGNAFLIILLRAFLFGAVFAVLGGGAAFLLDRFAKELFQTGEPGDGMKKEKENVNILIDEENTEKETSLEELALEDAQELDAVSSEDAEDYDVAKNISLENGEKDTGMDSAAGDDMVTPASGIINMKNELDDDEFDRVQSPTGDDAEGTESAKNVQDVAEIGLEMGKKQTEKKESDEPDELDVLPDMSAFESSFSSVAGTSDGIDAAPFDGFENASLKTTKLDKDPVIYAKALRTIIKRDEGKKK